MRPLVYGKRHSQEIIFKYAGYASAWSTTGISTKPYITTGYYVQQSASVEVQYFWKSTHYSITHAILRSKVQCVKAHSDEIKLRFTHRSAGVSPLRASPKHGRFRGEFELGMKEDTRRSPCSPLCAYAFTRETLAIAQRACVCAYLRAYRCASGFFPPPQLILANEK